MEYNKDNDRLNFIFGGSAGAGPNILTHIFGEAMVRLGYYVFYSRDYQSLIRGGHNFNILTLSMNPINSNDSKIDVLVCLDDKTKILHSKELKKDGIVIESDKNHSNMYYAGRIFKLIGLDFSVLDSQLKLFGKGYNNNVTGAKKGYDGEKRLFCDLNIKAKQKGNFINGTQGIALGAKKSGLDIYYAYPMTPATPLLNELAENQLEENRLVIELENEIAVANAGVGSAMTGKKVMVGTSGGGFDLMTETLSLTGIAEIPLVFYLSQRPGPGTGVATYTAQGDLYDALYSGHGEFQRVVLAPGDPLESIELTNQSFYFSHKYRIPSILLGDKHLSDSFYTITKDAKTLAIESEIKLRRFNSYESDADGSATENPDLVGKNIIRRMKKVADIEKDSENFENYKNYGNANSNNVVVSWGSTKGAILDAVRDLDCKFVQILYMVPFPRKVAKEIDGKNVILVENNSTGQLSGLIRKETGTLILEKNKILRFDGRPFFADELNKEIRKRLLKDA